MSIAISVLVPVYNVENTLDRCLNSILNQTFKEYEVILVDDGSTDNSGRICDEYAEKYENFRVIHKPNEGLGPTRNVGIREAKGEFVYHCDSDDWLKEDLLEKTYDTITKDHSDIVLFGYELFTEKDSLTHYGYTTLPACQLNSKNEVRRFFIEQYYNSFSVLSACNRLYRKNFLVENELYFPPLRRCQDMAYSLDLFDKATKISALKECYYCYIIEPGVFKGRSFEEMIEIYLTVHKMTQDMFENWKMYEGEEKAKLINRTCEHLANYSSYAFIVKYANEWKNNAKSLCHNELAYKLFSQYTGSSKFMKIFAFAVKVRNIHLIRFISMLQQRKVG